LPTTAPVSHQKRTQQDTTKFIRPDENAVKPTRATFIPALITEKGQCDTAVPLPCASSLTESNIFYGCGGTRDKFVEPLSTLRNGSDEFSAGLGPDRPVVEMLSRFGGCDDLTRDLCWSLGPGDADDDLLIRSTFADGQIAIDINVCRGVSANR
jgi:hypothetical protein